MAPRPVALAAAVEALGELLELHDGKVPAAELERVAADRAISRRTMTRARAVLGTASVRDGRGWVIIRPFPTREVH